MSPQKTISTTAWILILSLSLIWGAVFLSARLALNEVGPLTIVAHRTFWAALLLWGVVAVRRIPLPHSPRIWIGFFGMGVLNNVIPFGLISWAQLHIESGLASILNASTAVFGVLVAAIFMADERLGPRKAIGVLVAFFGVAMTIGLDTLREFDLRSLAQIAMLVATLSYAFAGVWARKMLGDLPAVLAAAGMLTSAALVSVPAAWLLEAPLTLALDPVTLAALAYSAIFATALAYLIYYKVLTLAGSGNLLLVTMLIPLFAIALGALVLGEALPPNAFAGFLLLALGLVIIDGRLGRRFGV